MKKLILNYLVCPKCKKVLKLINYECENNKIKNGILKCVECNNEFKILNYIPRFVSSEKYTKSFGKEWNWFNKVKNIQNDLDKEMKELLGLDKEDIKDKLVLEVGCGSGPYLDICANKYKARHIIGVDLSSAVDVAYRNVGHLENVTIIQADLFELPFRYNMFDVVYSIGVLHHTPDTKQAFKSIAKYVKKNGILSIWVYGYYWPPKIKNQQRIRKILKKLSLKQLYYFSKFMANLYYLYKIPFIGNALREVFPMGMDNDKRLRALNTFDMYSPEFINYHYIDEVYNWFEEEGFIQIKPTRYIIGMKGIKK